MNAKRIIALLLVVCTALICLTSCGKKTPVEQFAKELVNNKLDGAKNCRLTTEKKTGSSDKVGYFDEKIEIFSEYSTDQLDLYWNQTEYSDDACHCNYDRAADEETTYTLNMKWRYITDKMPANIAGTLKYRESSCDDPTLYFDYSFEIKDPDAVVAAMGKDDAEEKLIKTLKDNMVISGTNTMGVNPEDIVDWEANEERIEIMLEIIVDGMEIIYSTANKHGYNLKAAA